MIRFWLLQCGAMCLRRQQAPTLHSKNSAPNLPSPLTAALSQHWPKNAAQPWSTVVSRYLTHSRLLSWVGGYRAFVKCCFTDSSCLAVLPAAHSCISSHECLCWMGQAYGIHNNILPEEVLIHIGSQSSWSLQEKAWYQSPNKEDEAGAEDYTQWS